MTSDKGNNKGNTNLAKFIFWFDVEVKDFLFDVDCTNESTPDIMDAMNHSLKRIFPMLVRETWRTQIILFVRARYIIPKMDYRIQLNLCYDREKNMRKETM